MLIVRRWKAFHRLFAIVTALWIVYLTIVVPIRLRHRAETRLGERLANCAHFTPEHTVAYDGECMDIAEHLYVIDKNVAGSYFGPEGLLTLFAAALGMPLAFYGLIAGSALLLRHLRRTRSDEPPQGTAA
ncbi:hypothetical protein ACFPT7_23565 [Acidicapsa dinghuensis]|uniref:PepSY domain-containing protein n=1 Tax=Acidicapsa dinghuensis TaxID=2218256 RepID=A0ABW1EN11_9BACT|nr:hypothetical protein [Acidicapsa dinghuensis]